VSAARVSAIRPGKRFPVASGGLDVSAVSAYRLMWKQAYDGVGRRLKAGFGQRYSNVTPW
jgi:hypothetical protein